MPRPAVTGGQQIRCVGMRMDCAGITAAPQYLSGLLIGRAGRDYAT